MHIPILLIYIQIPLGVMHEKENKIDEMCIAID